MKTKFSALESELSISKIVSNNLSIQIKTLEQKCYENKRYSRRECLEISSNSGSIHDDALGKLWLDFFHKSKRPCQPLK